MLEGYEYRSHVLRQVDADTYHLEVELGLDVRIRLSVRLAGINAPEMSTDEGKAASVFAALWLQEHAPAGALLLRTIKDRREKYGRYLGVIVPLDDPTGEDLGAALLRTGHAVPYSG